MRKHILSSALMICGIVALIGGFTMLPSPRAASAQATEPSPRPTLQPTFGPDSHHKPTPVIPGRLTGTIIDLRTGAPASGVAVVIGDQVVYSDSNGNYDIWLTSGYYQLELKPTSNQGSSAQPTQQVAVGAGDTVVVHLFFTSLAPTIVEAAVPQAAVPTPTVVLAMALPPSLPNTSVAHHTAAARHLAESAAAPQSLPNTAAPTGMGSPGTWLIFGALLLGLGALIQLTPRRRRRATPRRRAARSQRSSSDEDVLSDLLSRAQSPIRQPVDLHQRL